MSFPKHCDYKDSGVDWLGRIPMHWDVGQSRRLFALRNERADPDDQQLTASQDHGVIPQKMFMEIEGRRVVQVILNAEILKHVEPGDFVISMRSFQGGIEYATHRGCISSAYVTLIPSHKVHGPFFKYLLKSQTYIQALQSTTNLVRDGQALRYQNFTMVDLPLVPIDEQKEIASFLDVETSKIDALVSEQRRLIELLKEKRQAVISHAVTKGLNPNAPMKPSGIQWLGDVPEHWEVKAFQRCVSVAEGQVDPQESEYSDMILVAPNHIESGTGRLINLENADEQGAISGKYFCNAGNVIYSKIRPALRKVCIAPEDCLCSADMYPLHAHSGLTNEFLFRWILTEQFSAFAVLESDRVAMPKINRESLKQVRFAIPPIDEQKVICNHISRKTMAFDALQAEAERAIELLQERRTALISAAVTGKIDVRSFGKQGA